MIHQSKKWCINSHTYSMKLIDIELHNLLLPSLPLLFVLKGIQGSLLSKLKALDAIQEKNASLQQEIATLRNTLGCGKG